MIIYGRGRLCARSCRVIYGHQPECVSTMARPVMIWPKANTASLVYLFVIPAQCLAPCLGRRFIEPDGREQAADSLYAP